MNLIFNCLLDSISKFYDIVISSGEECGSIVVSLRKKLKAKYITFLDEKGTTMALLVMTDTQKVTVTLSIKDSKGHPASVDGVPVWSSSDGAVCSVAPSDDGMSAEVSAVDMGVCQITAEADADLGAGVESIQGFLDVNISAGKATAVELTAGTPSEQ